jgi:hypothetical protein
MGRAAFGVVLVAFLVAVLLGVAGPSTNHSVASGEGFELAVHSTNRTRAGLAAPLAVSVSRSDAEALGDLVTVAITSEYLALFDENGVHPDAESATADDQFTYWTFEPPTDGPLAVSFDLRTEPGLHRPVTGDVVLLLEDRPVASVAVETVVVP